MAWSSLESTWCGCSFSALEASVYESWKSPMRYDISAARKDQEGGRRMRRRENKDGMSANNGRNFNANITERPSSR